jgi:hypothetical protein
MTAERGRVTILFTLATVALVIVLGLHPVATERIVAGYVLALAAIGLGALTRMLGSRSVNEGGSLFEHALSRKRPPFTRPPELVRIEREITLGGTSAGHLRTRLLPLLREAAAARTGIDFELQPDRAHAALGDETWELLRPDRPAPVDRNAAGLPLRRVRAVVERLEQL